MESLEIRPLSGTIGAEISNCAIGAIVESGSVNELRHALLHYKVLFFTHQSDLSFETQIAFGKLFGELEIDFPSFTQKPEERPEVSVFDGAVTSGRASIVSVVLIPHSDFSRDLRGFGL